MLNPFPRRSYNSLGLREAGAEGVLSIFKSAYVIPEPIAGQDGHIVLTLQLGVSHFNASEFSQRLAQGGGEFSAQSPISEIRAQG